MLSTIGFSKIVVLNPGKLNYMLIGNQDQPDETNFNGTEITNSKDEKLLGLFIN